jgi:hypothetical protein
MPENQTEVVQLSPAEVLRRAEVSMKLACEFFKIEEAWKIRVLAAQDVQQVGAAEIHINYPYMFADIYMNIEYYTLRPHLIHGDMGHEVAHLTMCELDYWFKLQPADLREREADAWRAGLERANTRNERVFVRCVADPHVLR